MAADSNVPTPQWLAQQLQTDDPDMLRSIVKTMAEVLMSADADGLCGAAYGERSDERVNSRKGYRTRQWDTRAVQAEHPPSRAAAARRPCGAVIEKVRPG
ncbi:hypothetical protein DP939_36665 [Spongiactinospora rosea]|uniref:Mutator family transposase n=1 Tax=Spongiactinospora rosea TaxID=2248750 RepID=A0A366LMV1_9ACTN|nr:hypothetical protein DP939_36665 [Spongiactinospora rosea]